MVNYFSQLLKATYKEWAVVIECVYRRISEDQNAELLEPIADEEVKRALFNMRPDKTLGPDGMSLDFYQKY